MNTYNIIGSMFGALLIALPIAADNTQQAYKNLKIQNKAIRKVGNQVKVAMDLNLDQIQLASNKGLIYTPIILNEKDTLFMPSVEVMGKMRYIYYQRNQKTRFLVTLIINISHFTHHLNTRHEERILFVEDYWGIDETFVAGKLNLVEVQVHSHFHLVANLSDCLILDFQILVSLLGIIGCYRKSDKQGSEHTTYYVICIHH